MSEIVETTIWVCQYDNCLRRRSQAVLTAFNQIELPAGTTVAAGNCQGQCHMGPNVMVVRRSPIDLGSSGERPLWYCEVKPEDAEEIIRSTEPVKRLLNPRLHFY
jgi:(2Fe-2S) ferredoxin